MGRRGRLHRAGGGHPAVGSANTPRPCAADRPGRPLLRSRALLQHTQWDTVHVERMGFGRAGGAGKPTSDSQNTAGSARARGALLLLHHRSSVVLSMVVRGTYDPRYHWHRNVGLLRTQSPQSGRAVEAGGLVHRTLHRRIRGQFCHGAAYEVRRHRMPHSRLVWVEASVRGDRSPETASRRAR